MQWPMRGRNRPPAGRSGRAIRVGLGCLSSRIRCSGLVARALQSARRATFISWRASMSRLFVSVSFTCCALAACGDNIHPLVPDAPSEVPRDPGGSFAVRSELDLPLPAAASAAFQPLIDATNDPDDPSRYLLDRLVDELPVGTAQTIAREAVPLLAAYMNEHIDELAPRLRSGLDAIAQGLPAVARHVGTTESWIVDPAGGATRIV